MQSLGLLPRTQSHHKNPERVPRLLFFALAPTYIAKKKNKNIQRKWTEARGGVGDALTLVRMCFCSHSKTKCVAQLGFHAVVCMGKKKKQRGECVRGKWNESEMFQRVLHSNLGTQQREL